MQIKCTSCGASNNNNIGQSCNFCGNKLIDDTIITERIKALNSNGNLFKLAEVAFEGENYLEAINYYNKCLEIDSDFFEAWYKKGVSIIFSNTTENNNSNQAIVSLKQAINFAPDFENFIKRLKKEIIPYLNNFYFNNLNSTNKFNYDKLNNLNNITNYIIDDCLLNEEEKKSLINTFEKFKSSFAEYFLVKNQSMFEVEKFDFVVSETDRFINKLSGKINNIDSENKINMKNNKTLLTRNKNRTVKNPKILWLIGIAMIFLLVKLNTIINTPNPTWCDCDKAAGEAIEYSLFQGREGSSAKYDKNIVTACAEKAIQLTDLKIEPKEMDINYLAQIAYEICKNGYYEGKYADDRGKKYYPKED